MTARTVGDILADLDANPPLGDNGPPTPYEQTKAEISDLYEEAKNWLDGEPIATKGQASEIAKLRDKLRTAAKAGEARRVEEAKPFDEAKAEVQERYNPLIHKDKGMAKRALDACNAALEPWLKRIDDEQRAESLRLRTIAEDAARQARDAAQVAAQTTDLGARERAEDMLAVAKNIAGTMKAAEKAKPQVHGGGRAVGMKSVWNPELTDPAAALDYFRQMQPAALKEWMVEQAKTAIRIGPKPPGAMPGFKINEDRVAV